MHDHAAQSNLSCAIVKASFKVGNGNVIVDLQHHQNGLPFGSELISKKSGLSWKVHSRMLVWHAMHEQRIFNNEKIEKAHVRFASLEGIPKSIESIKAREAQNIFEYILNPVGHEQKPEEGEELQIIVKQ